MNQRQVSTTAYPILIYMVLSANGLPATGITLTVTLSKNGAAFGAAAGAVSEIGNGWYALAGNATDRNTLGPLAVRATGTGCVDFAGSYEVITADPFAANMGLANLDAAVSSRLATADYTAPDNAGIAAIKVKTDQLTFTVAGRVDATAEVDISTVAGAVWGYPDRTLTVPAVVSETSEGAEITVIRGDYRPIVITGLGSLVGRTALWFTVKRSFDMTDAQAMIQITEDDGLIVLNGQAVPPEDPDPEDPESDWAEITVDDEDAGDITITLTDDLARLLALVADFYYDVQILDADGNALTKTINRFNVLGDVTRAVEPES